MLFKKLLPFIIILVLMTLISALIVPEWIDVFHPLSNANRDILFSIRIPKTLTAICCGAILSVSGFILQQLFKNNLAGPYILGVSSGASLAVAFTILGASIFPFLSNGISISIAGFIGAFSVLVLILSITLRFGNGPIILLFGVILGQITGSVQGLLSYLATPGDLKFFTLWSLGSFGQVIDNELIILIAISVLGTFFAGFLMKDLSVMMLGNDVAKTLGVNTQNTTFKLLLITGLLTGLATAYCGPIAFIGMAIPNLCRILFKTANFKQLMYLNVVLGAIMALISDIISSLDIFGYNLPINVTTSLIGGPFILYILLKKRKK
jgi:iron complex transport system permease protein